MTLFMIMNCTHKSFQLFSCALVVRRGLISCVSELPSFCADNWQHTNQRQWAGTGHGWVRNVMADSGRWEFECDASVLERQRQGEGERKREHIHTHTQRTPAHTHTHTRGWQILILPAVEFENLFYL